MSLVLTCANLAIILIRCTDFDIIFLLRNVFGGGCLLYVAVGIHLISSTIQFGKAYVSMRQKLGFWDSRRISWRRVKEWDLEMWRWGKKILAFQTFFHNFASNPKTVEIMEKIKLLPSGINDFESRQPLLCGQDTVYLRLGGRRQIFVFRTSEEVR